MSLLFTNVRILDPIRTETTSKEVLGDVWIEDGKIAGVGQPGSINQKNVKRVIDGKGKWLMPGMVDAHVHLREPGLEHKETIETGTLAAVRGGYTSLACMANTKPVNDNATITSYIRERARSTGHCHVHPIGALSKGLLGKELAEIGGMVEEGAVAISDDGMPVMNSYLMRRGMEYAKTFDVPVISHAEDCNLSANGVMNEGVISESLGLQGNPAASEEIMVAREIALCRLTGARVHLAHISSKLSLSYIRRAKEEGLRITAEVTPHHLTMTDQEVLGYRTCCKMAPPLREVEDVEALQKALASGIIDFIATDHAPHTALDKDTEFELAANGVLGLQTSLSITLGLVKNEGLSLRRWLDAVTLAPSRFLKLEDPKISEGAKADLCLVDPDFVWKFSEADIVSRSKNTPWVGETLKGKVFMTLVKGKIAYEN